MPPFRRAGNTGSSNAASLGVTQTVTYKGIPVGLEYRAVKTLRLTVYPDCRVLAVIPRHTPPEAVYAFIEAKLPWIEKHLALYRERARKKPLGANRFVDGEIYYVWGVPFRLEVRERRGHPRIEAVVAPVAAKLPVSAELPAAATAGPAGSGDGTGNVLRMFVRPGAAQDHKQALLDKWRKQLVAEAAPALAAKWEQQLTGAVQRERARRTPPVLRVEKIYLQKMKTHWGSCNSRRRTIRLNTELAAKSPEYLDYVVLHEMIHLIVPSHNAVFYRYMNALLPRWKEIRKKMNRGE